MTDTQADKLVQAASAFVVWVNEYREWAAENGPTVISAGDGAGWWMEMLELQMTARKHGTKLLNRKLSVVVNRLYAYEQSDENYHEERAKRLAEAVDIYLKAIPEEAETLEEFPT